ncbi:MAG TPA: hypothetical protein VOA80_19440 [Thermoanaerobaculia bacterium]|nr:hypothetical protein [Thermoanaerobaculia bacterium]
MIKVTRQSKVIDKIVVDGEELHSDDGEVWFLPKALVRDLKVNNLPKDASFEVCDRVENDLVILDTIPIRFHRVGQNKIRCEFEDSGTRKYWDGKIGFKTYMDAKKAVVEDRSTEIGDITLDSYEDDGAYIHLDYSCELDAEKVQTAIEMAEQIVAEIDGTAELRLGSELWAPTSADNEQEFTLRTVLPILRKLGFQNVKYNHGRREFGRDILFARITEFQELEHWGAQVKFGNITGGADSEIDSLLGQIDDAFAMPFYDLYSKQKQWISKLAIIISGKFTENAIEKICEKIQSHVIRNNVLFIDGDKLQTMAERFSATRSLK